MTDVHHAGRWIRHGGWYPDAKLRLWDSRKGRWTGVNPHDRYELEPGSHIRHLRGDLLHYSFYTVEEHRQQVERFSTIAAKAMRATGERGGSLRAFLSSVARFVQGYLLRGGFLDGPKGFTIAWISAGAKWKKYTKLNALWKQGA